MNRYSQCLFFAKKTSAHAHARLSGAVVIVPATPTAAQRNGVCVKAITSADGADGVPLATWADPRKLAKRAIAITESEARALAPRMMAEVDRFQDRPEYRAMHVVEMVGAIVRGAVALQSADENVNAGLPTTGPVETDGPTGWKHHGPAYQWRERAPRL